MEDYIAEIKSTEEKVQRLLKEAGNKKETELYNAKLQAEKTITETQTKTEIETKKNYELAIEEHKRELEKLKKLQKGKVNNITKSAEKYFNKVIDFVVMKICN